MPATADSGRGITDFPSWPRSSSLGKDTIMFLPFHGTFFLRRGVAFRGARLAAVLEGVAGCVVFALGVPTALLEPPFPAGVLGLSAARIG